VTSELSDPSDLGIPGASPYIELDRDQWSALASSAPLPLTQADVEKLRGLGDPIDLAEVDAVYRPLTALLGLVAQGTHHQWQGLADGRAGLFGAGAQLLGDLLHGLTLQLGKQLLTETLVAHEDSCVSVGSAWSVGEGAPMIAAPVAGGRGLFRLKRVFALCFVWGLVLSLGCTLQEAGPGGGRL